MELLISLEKSVCLQLKKKSANLMANKYIIIHYYTVQPSYRAQKEHVEVLSRRFMNDYETKDGMKKNEIRTKLRLSVLDEIKKPGVQASHTIEELVQITLESKSPELLSDIFEVINIMSHPPDINVPQQATDTSNKTCTDKTCTDSSTDNKSISQLNTSSISSFELPIDILSFPGLSSDCPFKSESSNKKIVKQRQSIMKSSKDNVKKTTISKESMKRSIKLEVKTNEVPPGSEEEKVILPQSTKEKDDLIKQSEKGEHLVQADANQEVDEGEKVFDDVLVDDIQAISPSVRRSARLASHETVKDRKRKAKNIDKETKFTETKPSKRRRKMTSKAPKHRNIISSTSSDDRIDIEEERNQSPSDKTVKNTSSGSPPRMIVTRSYKIAKSTDDETED
jgi:hypothetical protein